MLSEKQIWGIFQTSDAIILAIIVTDLPSLTEMDLTHFTIFYTGINNA